MINLFQQWFSGVNDWRKTLYRFLREIWHFIAICFLLGIVSRATVRSNGLYNKLGGDEGILGIFDGLPNWSNLFGSSGYQVVVE